MSELEKRKKLSFAQAEGAEPLPRQLRKEELPPRLRSRIWDAVYRAIKEATNPRQGLPPGWRRLLQSFHVEIACQTSDSFNPYGEGSYVLLRNDLISDEWLIFYGAIQWLIRQSLPDSLRIEIGTILESEHAAFRIVDRDTLMPVGSEEEGQSIVTALEDARQAGLHGPFNHLKAASQLLTSGDYAASVRESIHSVESASRSLAGNAASLPKALGHLEKRQAIHQALKQGFSALYGYTSDEKGIRHALLDDGDAKVDETDALFMLGACAAFVTYLIRKNSLAAN